MKRYCLAALVLCAAVAAQEAESGFEIRSTWSVVAGYSHQLSLPPRSDGPDFEGTRLLLYPEWKLNSHWSFSGAVQVNTRPYFYEDFSTQGHGIRGDILRGHLTYSRIGERRSLVVRVGQMMSSFGSYLLRYDDAVNPLIDAPLSYGYYGRGVTSFGMMGAQVDASVARLDIRAQFTNSSPLNRRSIFDRDQYGTWSGGAGYTVKQGLRVGISGFRGPYLHRQFPFFFPGEARPKDLPATGLGLDAQWGHGPWNFYGELQRFQMDYRVIPNFKQNFGYAEARRTLHPRWYVAVRAGYRRSPVLPPYEVYEFAAGFRPNRHQLIKAGYEVQQTRGPRPLTNRVYAVQLVTNLPTLSRSRN